jgi:paraquat-inducible protein B
MSDTQTQRVIATVRAPVRKSRRFSLIWMIPLVTLLIGGWLIWDTYSKRGPTVVVSFMSGEGLQPGQSHVKHLDVDLGLVKSVVLAKDFSHVIVTLAMKPEAEPVLTDKALFWVVRPRLFAGSVSGLGTLVSGSYVELLPSSKEGKAQRSFSGLEDPPVLQTAQAGRTFLLKAPEIGSVRVGSPVFYRDIAAGQVLGWDLADNAESVTIHAFVRAPFDKFVTDQSRFWDASGVSVELGANGVRLQLTSVQALLFGGVAFEIPPGAPPAAPSAQDAIFPLFPSRSAAQDAGYVRRIKFVSYFTGAVSGLAVGSPVTFQGLHVGQVTGIGLEYDPTADALRVPVHYDVEPQRIRNVKLAEARGPLENTRMLVERGLRAELKSANLLTGAQEVALSIDPKAEPATLGQEGDVLVMPSVAGGFAGIEAAANQLLTKLSQMPFEQIGRNLNDTLEGASGLVNSPELAQTVVKLRATLSSADDVVRQVRAGVGPALKQLPAIAADLQASLARVGTLMGSVNTAYGADSKFNRDLDRLVLQLNDTATALRWLADLLTRHPEALARGRPSAGSE